MNNHPTLRILRTRLQAIHDSISHFQPPTRRPPIHDSSLDLNDTQWLQQDYIPGLRKLKDTIKIDLDVLDKVRDHPARGSCRSLTLPCHFSSFLEDPKSANLPPLSDECAVPDSGVERSNCAPARVVSVFKSFSSTLPSSTPAPRKAGGQKPSGTKVDVVADHGRRWIRVNTSVSSSAFKIIGVKCVLESKTLESWLNSGNRLLLD